MVEIFCLFRPLLTAMVGKGLIVLLWLVYTCDNYIQLLAHCLLAGHTRRGLMFVCMCICHTLGNEDLVGSVNR